MKSTNWKTAAALGLALMLVCGDAFAAVLSCTVDKSSGDERSKVGDVVEYDTSGTIFGSSWQTFRTNYFIDITRENRSGGGWVTIKETISIDRTSGIGVYQMFWYDHYSRRFPDPGMTRSDKYHCSPSKFVPKI